MVTNFAFMCTGTSGFEKFFGTETVPYLLALICIVPAAAELYFVQRSLNNMWRKGDKLGAAVTSVVNAVAVVGVAVFAWIVLSVATC